MTPILFDFTDYHRFLAAYLEALPNKGHGERARWSSAIGCHMTYISQVLNGTSQLSLEQGEKLCHYFKCNDEETDYFLLLISLARCGTKSLRARFEAKIRKSQAKRLDISHRVKSEKNIHEHDQFVYYSRWYISAIHVALAIPALRSVEALASNLGLTHQQVIEAINFLKSIGIVEEKKEGSPLITRNLHISNDRPSIYNHHLNWRLRAIESLRNPLEEDLHYSSVISFDRKDASKIKTILVNAIENIRSVVKESPEKELGCYALDFFLL